MAEPPTCPSCGAALPSDGGVCAACGATLRADAGAAWAPTLRRPADGDAKADDELQSGQVVGGRYRIERPLGKGGMGEVVLARDLELDQPVALKFLPSALRDDADHLARLREEVKLARRVSHVNVCRVHDLGEARGRWFLSMEYVDGEDLGSLLRRIGRLPPEKAIELAHQLCSGLHAAHEQGILHRDLKPANLMIDGQGRLKITDFGLAALAHRVAGAHVREGTPAYMAPEQLAGAEVTRKSDIHALGLVLYELFTGKRAHGVERGRDTRPAAPSTLLDGFDPAIERVIMRCLEPDPDDRPTSVLAVAAGLPGGDPIAAALAAGELPSPEMVAASGETGTLRRRTAVLLLALVLAPLVVLGALYERATVIGRLPTTHSPEVLAHQAAEWARESGGLPEGERAYWLDLDDDLRRNVETEMRRGVDVDELPSHPLQLWWRADPQVLEPDAAHVSANDPPFERPGSVLLRIDARGRLLELRRVPPGQAPAAEVPRPEPPWSRLLEHAGWNPATLTRATPRLVPRLYADTHVAWTGHWPDGSEARIEATSLYGVPVELLVLGPWDDAWPDAVDDAPQGPRWRTRSGAVVTGPFALAIGLGGVLLMLVFAAGFALLAYRSLRRGEGDRRTAARVGIAVLSLAMLSGVLGSHLVGPPADVVWDRVPEALREAAFVWLFYIAIEPYVRRFWPSALVSWTRSMRGRWRDPLVGRDVLIGLACASVGAVLMDLVSLIDPSRLSSRNTNVLLGARYAMAGLAWSVQEALMLAFTGFVVLLLLRMLLRTERRTIVAAIVLMAAPFVVFGGSPVDLVQGLGLGVLAAIVVFRGGLLGTVAGMTAQLVLLGFPISLASNTWYAGIGAIGALTVAAAAVVAFRVSLGGRSVFGDRFFGS